MAAVLTDRRARLQTSPLRHLDVVLVLAPVLISGLGLLMIYSATHTRLEDAGDDPLTFVKRQAVAIVLGIIAMVIMTVIDYRRLRELALFGYAVTVLMLVAVLGIGVQVKGAQARFDIGPLQLQPGELAKLFMILVLAGYCALHRGDLDVPPPRGRAVHRGGADRAHPAAAGPRDGPGAHVHHVRDAGGGRRPRPPPRHPRRCSASRSRSRR